MKVPDWAPRSMTDWVALAGALVFVMAGASMLARPETAMLRLVAYGWPAWAGWLPGAAYLGLGLALLHERARIPAALLLMGGCVIELVVHLAYRDAQELVHAAFRLFLAGLVLWLAHSEGPRPAT